MRLCFWLFQPLCYLWIHVNAMLLCQFHQKLFHVSALLLQIRQFNAELLCMYLQEGGRGGIGFLGLEDESWSRRRISCLYRKTCNCSIVKLCSRLLWTTLRYLYILPLYTTNHLTLQFLHFSSELLCLSQHLGNGGLGGVGWGRRERDNNRKKVNRHCTIYMRRPEKNVAQIWSTSNIQ